MSAATAVRAMVAALMQQPPHSILPDNGSEFAKRRAIAATLQTNIFFADPHAPWQRESDDSSNGCVRYFQRNRHEALKP